jgi:hypothetical protein
MGRIRNGTGWAGRPRNAPGGNGQRGAAASVRSDPWRVVDAVAPARQHQVASFFSSKKHGVPWHASRLLQEMEKGSAPNQQTENVPGQPASTRIQIMDGRDRQITEEEWDRNEGTNKSRTRIPASFGAF